MCIRDSVYGEFALSGAIFLSSLDNLEFDEGYHLLYGHHMDNGGMFGDIVEFPQESYFDSHTSGVFYLPDAAYDITLFACLEVDAYDQMCIRDRHFTHTYQFMDEDGSPIVGIQEQILSANETLTEPKSPTKDHAVFELSLIHICLLKMVGQRRGMLAYLKEKDIERYRALIAKLGLRK